jgi:predicted PurR-regulated permease PerM
VARARRTAIGAWAAVGVVVLLWAASWLLGRMIGVLTPFIYAAIIVYLLRPLVARLASRGIPRVWAVVLTYLGVTLVIVVLFGLLGPPLVGQIRELVDRLPQYWASTVDWLNGMRQAPSNGPVSRALSGWLDSTMDWLRNTPARASEIGTSLANILPRQAAAVGNVALNLFTAPVIAFFILLDLPALRNTMTRLLPHDHRPEFLEIMEEVDLVLAGYLRGRFLVSAAVGTLTFIGLLIASMFGYGLPYALAISLMAGVLDVVPYIGPWVAAVVAVIVGLFQSPLHALVAFAVLMIVQQIVATFMSPKIMADAVDLHPALVIFALLVGASEFGIMGMVLAIPIAAAAKAVFAHFFAKVVPEEPPVREVEGGFVGVGPGEESGHRDHGKDEVT